MSDASLDDLLRYDEEPKRDRPFDSPRMWLVKAVVYAATAALLVVFGARTLGIGLPYPVVFAGLLAMFVLQRVLHDIAPAPSAPDRADQPAGEESWQLSWPISDGLLSASNRWDNRLSWTQSDPERFARNVQPLIAELADERLRQKHGLTRQSDPVRARALLGDPLWTFLATPVTKSPTPQQIAAVASELEKL
ncbi:MAG TPA: hypothetical protein VFE14_12145 [Micromonosporaceae bacterium]|nr:hypothetical protein [Micromonosporaceae bacterium]